MCTHLVEVLTRVKLRTKNYCIIISIAHNPQKLASAVFGRAEAATVSKATAALPWIV